MLNDYNMADGNLNINIDTRYKDEVGMLASGFSHMADVIKKIVTEINEIEKKFRVKGDIEAKIDSTNFKGSYFEVAEGMVIVDGGTKYILPFSII